VSHTYDEVDVMIKAKGEVAKSNSEFKQRQEAGSFIGIDLHGVSLRKKKRPHQLQRIGASTAFWVLIRNAEYSPGGPLNNVYILRPDFTAGRKQFHLPAQERRSIGAPENQGNSSKESRVCQSCGDLDRAKPPLIAV
jgi:hypothetical protein